jgi:hypothetical protein
MTKKLCAVLLLSLGWAAVSLADDSANIPPKTHPDSSGWQDLFASDLSNANCAKPVWSFHDGMLTATEDELLWTKKQYDNYIVDLEFKYAPGANSGVFVYMNNLTGTGPGFSHWLEVQIQDDFDARWANVPKTWLCGGIFGYLAPKRIAVKKPGEWNRMTITCKGPMIYVLLNGVMVTEMDLRKWTSAKKNPDGSEIPAWLTTPPAKMPTKGYIGLQGLHGRGVRAPVYFRNLKVKTLPSR